jgi:hypothetical protein
MQSYITILTFHYPHEMDIARAYLEAHGIVCFAKDEFTVQNDHMFSPAVGGVKLQVKQEDYARAGELLKAAGYMKDTQYTQPKTPRWHQFASRVPVLRHWLPEYRISFVVAVVVVALLVVVYMLFFTQQEVLSTSAPFNSASISLLELVQ